MVYVIIDKGIQAIINYGTFWMEFWSNCQMNTISNHSIKEFVLELIEKKNYILCSVVNHSYRFFVQITKIL